jgi:hypothetical protein
METSGGEGSATIGGRDGGYFYGWHHDPLIPFTNLWTLLIVNDVDAAAILAAAEKGVKPAAAVDSLQPARYHSAAKNNMGGAASRGGTERVFCHHS